MRLAVSIAAGIALRVPAVPAGFDVARDPKDTHMYLTFGNAWQ